MSALHHRPFSPDILAREFPGEGTESALIQAARKLGFRTKTVAASAARLAQLPMPLLVAVKALAPPPEQIEPQPTLRLGLLTSSAHGQLVFFEACTNTPQTLDETQLDARLAGPAWMLAPEVEEASDADAAEARASGVSRRFGFKWFVPELLRHRKVWRDVLWASLALQIVALATPLFTQAIVDKVVVHRTQSTLIAIGVVMGIFVVFSAVLT